ncbi:hypothetical protein ID866_10141, partial [Astraeus odoratus]
MSSPCHTLSPHEHCLAKTKAPEECMEEEWRLVSEDQEKKQRVEVWKDKCQQRWKEADKRAWEEAEHLACKEATRKAQEEAERKVEEECKAWEAAVRAKEEAKKKEREEREAKEAAKRAAEAVEERADAKRRALKEHLWEAAGQWSEMVVAPLQVAKPSGRMTMGGPSAPGQRASGVQDPCTWCCNKGTPCVLGATKGKTMACKACCHMKQLEEMVEVGKDDEEEEVQSHFVVLPHLTEDHWDALGALTTTLDKLFMDFLAFQQDSWDLGVAMLRVMEAIADKLWRLN